MRPDEYLTSGGDARELTPQELELAKREDPEVVLITDYLAGALPPDEARAVAARLQGDPAFYQRVGVIVEAWHAWPTARDFALPEEELATESRRFRREGEQLLRMGERAPWGDDDAARDDAVHDRARDRARDVRRDALNEAWRDTAFRQLQRSTRRWQLAAGLIAVVALPAAVWGTLRLTAPVPRPEYRMVRPGAEESIPVRLDDDALAVVDAGARLTWNDSANANGTRELFLEGVAQFQMRRARKGRYVVITPSARIWVNGSDFQVRAVDPSVTKVHVQDGEVLLNSRGDATSPLLTLRTGERGVAYWRQAPGRVN
ncbi:MAG: FecR domain-containing protein [Gemmatimonadetes bacterium]|nr:FecR domain-containing protein [Gemmatimonadota bacterium]